MPAIEPACLHFADRPEGPPTDTADLPENGRTGAGGVARMRPLTSMTNPRDGMVVWSPVKSLWFTTHALVALVGGYFTFRLDAAAFACALTLITLCLGHSVGLHRLLIHRSFECHLWLEYLLVHNHHAVPGSARLGLCASQFDPGWRALVAMRAIGLVWNLKQPADLPARPELRTSPFSEFRIEYGSNCELGLVEGRNADRRILLTERGHRTLSAIQENQPDRRQS